MVRLGRVAHAHRYTHEQGTLNFPHTAQLCRRAVVDRGVNQQLRTRHVTLCARQCELRALVLPGKCFPAGHTVQQKLILERVHRGWNIVLRGPHFTTRKLIQRPSRL